jgi:HK97 family phage portal protein
VPTVISMGQLTGGSPPRTWYQPWASHFQAADRWLEYGTIYRSQPAVGAAVDLFARNIAQCGLHLYARAGENDRRRIRDHPLVRLLAQPNGWSTDYRFIYATVADKKVYGSAYWLKWRELPRGPLSLLRIPPQWVEVSGGLMPTQYKINLYPDPLTVRPDQIVHFRSYNPDSPVVGLSPLERLRLVLDQDMAAIEQRRDVMHNAGRQPLVITRPSTAPRLSGEGLARFSEQFTAALRNPRSTATPILEDDMAIHTLSFSAEQSQWVEGRQLTWEEVARSYNIPLSMFGIAGAPQTYASVREFHKILYQDTLGPDIAEIESDIELQLFPEFPDLQAAGAYCEFNIFEKMQGTLEEQIDTLIAAAGAPILTRNEARARINAPHIAGADTLAVPLNVGITAEDGAMPVAEPAPAEGAPAEEEEAEPAEARSNGRVAAGGG